MIVSVLHLYNEKPNAYLPATRQRLMIVLGMRDERNDNYANEDRVNNGYESDAYWAGRMIRSWVAARHLP